MPGRAPAAALLLAPLLSCAACCKREAGPLAGGSLPASIQPLLQLPLPLPSPPHPAPRLHQDTYYGNPVVEAAYSPTLVLGKTNADVVNDLVAGKCVAGGHSRRRGADEHAALSSIRHAVASAVRRCHASTGAASAACSSLGWRPRPSRLISLIPCCAALSDSASLSFSQLTPTTIVAVGKVLEEAPYAMATAKDNYALGDM